MLRVALQSDIALQIVLSLAFEAMPTPPPPQFGGRIWPNLPNWSAELFGF